MVSVVLYTSNALLMFMKDSRLSDAEEIVANLSSTIKELEIYSAQKEAEANDAYEEVQLVLAQLHETQKELEYYFLLSRQQSELLDATSTLQSRTIALLV